MAISCGELQYHAVVKLDKIKLNGNYKYGEYQYQLTLDKIKLNGN